MTVRYVKIGDRIRALRELNNLSIADVATRTNFTSKSLVLAENGHATLSLEFVLSMCNVFHVTPNDLLRGEFEEQEVPMAPTTGLSTSMMEEPMRPIQISPSRTKIKDTQETLDQIERMVVEQKRSGSSGNTPEKKERDRWSGTYYK